MANSRTVSLTTALGLMLFCSWEASASPLAPPLPAGAVSQVTVGQGSLNPITFTVYPPKPPQSNLTYGVPDGLPPQGYNPPNSLGAVGPQPGFHYDPFNNLFGPGNNNSLAVLGGVLGLAGVAMGVNVGGCAAIGTGCPGPQNLGGTGGLGGSGPPGGPNGYETFCNVAIGCYSAPVFGKGLSGYQPFMSDANVSGPNGYETFCNPAIGCYSAPVFGKGLSGYQPFMSDANVGGSNPSSATSSLVQQQNALAQQVLALQPACAGGSITACQQIVTLSNQLQALAQQGGGGGTGDSAKLVAPTRKTGMVQVSSLGSNNVSSNTVKFTIPTTGSTTSTNQSTITGGSSSLGAGATTPSAVKLSIPAASTSSSSQSTITGTGTPSSPSNLQATPKVKTISSPSRTVAISTPNVASRAVSNAASNAASRAASSAASRAASNAASNAASRAASNAASAAASRAASNVRIPSDIRLKRDIVELGLLPNGLHLYRYRYIGDSQHYVGVMAQEVAQYMPSAVVGGSDGYLQVDYTQLGIELLTFDEWIARNAGQTRYSR